MYKVIIEARVYNDLDRIPAADLDRIYTAITSLELDPRRTGTQKLQGQANRYRIRQGNYRIIYQIHEAEKAVLVLLVGHRRDVYRN